jgi:hypothetical protein
LLHSRVPVSILANMSSKIDAVRESVDIFIMQGR